MGATRGGADQMKILVLGGAGMLGHKMVQTLTTQYEDVWWTLRGRRDDARLAPVPLLRGDHAIENVDAADMAGLRKTIERVRPDAVVNCIGLIKQRPEGQSPIEAITINSLLPHVVAESILPWRGRLIHFSTDCVFNGRRGNYTETDVCDAEDVYGRSKALGESVAANVLTLRTSIIGRELSQHQSLLDWFLAQRGGTVRGFRRHIWSGVTTNHLAEVTARALREWSALSGIYQVSSGSISKYDLLLLVRDVYSLPVVVEPDETQVLDRSMSGAKLAAATGYHPPPMITLLEQIVSDPTPYPQLGR
jgi:dTDP-4-dehydrorhamnose reductase